MDQGRGFAARRSDEEQGVRHGGAGVTGDGGGGPSDGRGERPARAAVRRQQLNTREIRPLDILLGKGKPYQDHPGNLRMHRIINQYRDEYSNASRADKPVLAKLVISTILGEGGARFLRRVDVEGAFDLWEVVSDEVARDKISHAFRNRPRKDVDLHPRLSALQSLQVLQTSRSYQPLQNEQLQMPAQAQTHSQPAGGALNALQSLQMPQTPQSSHLHASGTQMTADPLTIGREGTQSMSTASLASITEVLRQRNSPGDERSVLSSSVPVVASQGQSQSQAAAQTPTTLPASIAAALIAATSASSMRLARESLGGGGDALSTITGDVVRRPNRNMDHPSNPRLPPSTTNTMTATTTTTMTLEDIRERVREAQLNVLRAQPRPVTALQEPPGTLLAMPSTRMLPNARSPSLASSLPLSAQLASLLAPTAVASSAASPGLHQASMVTANALGSSSVLIDSILRSTSSAPPLPPVASSADQHTLALAQLRGDASTADNETRLVEELLSRHSGLSPAQSAHHGLARHQQQDQDQQRVTNSASASTPDQEGINRQLLSDLIASQLMEWQKQQLQQQQQQQQHEQLRRRQHEERQAQERNQTLLLELARSEQQHLARQVQHARQQSLQSQVQSLPGAALAMLLSMTTPTLSSTLPNTQAGPIPTAAAAAALPPPPPQELASNTNTDDAAAASRSDGVNEPSQAKSKAKPKKGPG